MREFRTITFSLFQLGSSTSVPAFSSSSSSTSPFPPTFHASKMFEVDSCQGYGRSLHYLVLFCRDKQFFQNSARKLATLHQYTCRWYNHHQSRYQLFSRQEFCPAGKVVLAYPGRGENFREGSYWFVDPSLRPHLLANDTHTYWRLVLAHLGMPQWQALVAGLGLTPWARVKS